MFYFNVFSVQTKRKQVDTASFTDSTTHTLDQLDEIIPIPSFVVYSTLGETTLLAIVNAGRALYDSKKEDGLHKVTKYTPLYRPLEELEDKKKVTEEDVIDELVQDQINYHRIQASKHRKKMNKDTEKERQKKQHASNEKSKQAKRKQAAVKKLEAGEVGTIVTIPGNWQHRRHVKLKG